MERFEVFMEEHGKFILETERLILREMTDSDFNALSLVLCDKENMKYFDEIFDEKRVKRWIERSIKSYRVFGFGFWAVCLKETGEMIGDCGVTMQNINGFISPEIGYHLRANQQKKGYIKEAAMAVRDWIFENTTFNTIFSYMTKSNIPSQKVAVSYGCKKVEEYNDNGKDIIVYAITREEWKNRH
ncbi:MAG: GNAT family protein [Peptostreptococcaceae bacterium]|nr:GNAT family protein [Peptostreptococcaceae bacterium]